MTFFCSQKYKDKSNSIFLLFTSLNVKYLNVNFNEMKIEKGKDSLPEI